MSLFNYFKKVSKGPKSNISNQNSSGNISENNKQLPEESQETNTNSATTETETEILECSNNEFLQNCNENNETNLLNMAISTTTKLSTADTCSKIALIGTSDEHSVSDLGNKIDGPKQAILESSKYSH